MDVLKPFKENGWFLLESLSTELHKGQESFQVVLLPLGLCAILFCFVLFWFGVFKVILICTTLGEGGKIAERNELASLREMAGLGLRQQALVCVSLSLNTYSSGVRSRGERIQNRHPRGSAHCLSLPLPCFYLPGQPEAENIINYAECFFPLLFKVSCWTSQGTCLDKLRPGVLINLKVSTLGSQVNIFPLGHLGLAEP